MSFLPIVTRELRAGARQRSTYRIRRWTALVAWIVTFFMMIVATSIGGRGGRGQVLFSFLTVYAAVLSLLAGPLLTADALSEEKRDGTLGFLFLTDLRGYDVVLGKFFARSLNAFYGLLGLVPMMAVTILLGGVTAGEVWRMSLALANGLFLSLAVGLGVSAVARHSRTAAGAASLLIFLLAAGLPILALALPTFQPLPTAPWLAAVSPFYSYAFGKESRYFSNSSAYWISLGVSHFIGWFFLLFASWWLPRHWQEVNPFSIGLWSRHRQRLGHTSTRGSKARANLLSVNPILWLMSDEPMLKGLLWIIVITWGIVELAAGWLGSAGWGWNLQFSKIVAFALKVLVAMQACRFFTEARRTGALELLISTPLRTQDIVKGQWMALRKIFLLPFVFFVAFCLLPSVIEVVKTGVRSGLADLPPALLNGAGHTVLAGWGALGLIADYFAAGWVGMYFSLTAKNPRFAAVRTILFVVVLPSIATCGLDLILDLVWIAWASSKLKQDFRWLMERERV